MSIGGVSSQDGHLIACILQWEMKGHKEMPSTWFRFHALIQTLKHWRPYFIHREFILFADHESSKYLHSQKKLSPRHASWFSFLLQFSFVIRHKTCYENKLVDAFSRRPHSSTILSTISSVFASMKNSHFTNLDFQKIWKSINSSPPHFSSQLYCHGQVLD